MSEYSSGQRWQRRSAPLLLTALAVLHSSALLVIPATVNVTGALAYKLSTLPHATAACSIYFTAYTWMNFAWNAKQNDTCISVRSAYGDDCYATGMHPWMNTVVFISQLAYSPHSPTHIYRVRMRTYSGHTNMPS